MTPLGPNARALIDAADGTDTPGADDKERMRARLAASIGASIVGAAAAGAAVKSTTATAMLKGATGGAAGTTLLGKILAAVLLTGALSVGYVAGRRSDVEATRAGPAPTAPVVAATGNGARNGAPPVTAASPTPSDAIDEPANTVATSRTPAAGPAFAGRRPAAAATAPQTAQAIAAPPSPAPSVNDSTEGEAAMLQRARAAIDSGDGVTALDALDAAERKFPGGLLADQRRAERVVAMCTIAKVPVTRERAERFLADRPRSQQADRIRRACGLP